MIDELHAKNVALIKDAALYPSEYLTVLTGETGAGKTALLGALKLLVGERSDSGLVREGAEALEVEGRIYLGASDSEGIVVKRRINRQGRSRVSLNDSMATLSELSDTVGASVDLCGQHEHQKLLQVASHVEMLDSWIGASAQDALSAYREALAQVDELKTQLEELRAAASVSQELLEKESFVLDRINEVDPKRGELEELEAALPKAEHAEMLMDAVYSARRSLVNDGGADERLSDAIDNLRSASSHDESLASYADTIQSALIDIEDVAMSLRDYQDSIDLDSEALVAMQQRMAALQGLMYQYGPGMDDVFARKQKAEDLLVRYNCSDDLQKELEQKLAQAHDVLYTKASELDSLRKEYAPKFCDAITEQMQKLEMTGASVQFAFTELAEDSWTAQGKFAIELMYCPGKKMGPRPLKKIASGGEISRVMLACKVVLGTNDSVDTLVFDEVDAGVGGSVAKSLAQVLKTLASTHQTIVVTHLAQVAVLADTHYLVKKTPGDIPETHLVEISGEDRVQEIARMLSGDTTQASLDHARQMLSEAQSMDVLAHES